MTPSRIASVTAMVGGLCWLARFVLVSAGIGVGSGLPGLLHWGGTALLVVALLASGYALVATAPVWLRLVVSVAETLLVLAVWQVVEAGLGSARLASLVGGVLALAAGAFGLVRARRAPPAEKPVRGRRAAR
jgi:hypothetical protein